MKKYLAALVNPFFILALSCVFLFFVFAMRLQTPSLTLHQPYSVSMADFAPMEHEYNNEIDTFNLATPLLPDYQYRIQFGDNLNKIFKKLNISERDIRKLHRADHRKSRLKKLKIGDELTFWFAKDRKTLNKLLISFDPHFDMLFKRKSQGDFYAEEVKIKAKWEPEIITARVEKSFSLAAMQAGLNFAEIDKMTELFYHRINLHRDLRVGDRFSIIRSAQFIKQKPTGKHLIEAIQLQVKGQRFSAYLHIDGQYYDEKGEPIVRTFLRYPTKKKIDVSSHFNLDRRHPISKKSIPHKGTDFYANTGTQVIATADGIVKAARYHSVAGHYLVLDHGHQFVTRYLHNNKLLVKRGQKVKRGQVIAISGRSGKVTGPHIHYELWVRGKPIDPMSAIIPLHKTVPKFQHFLYQRLVKKYDQIINLSNASKLSFGKGEQGYKKGALAMKESKKAQ